MQRSRVDILLHFAWATENRQPLLTPERERLVCRCIEAEARRLDCVVLALGGMPDHVHLVVSMPGTLSPARLMQAVKGVSSKVAREQPGVGRFGWQSNYAVVSFGPRDKERVVGYVSRQKEHHAAGTLWPMAEQFCEVVEAVLADGREEKA